MKHLPYSQYYIDCNIHHRKKTVKVRQKFTYKDVSFTVGKTVHHANYIVLLDEERKVIQIFFEASNGPHDWRDNLTFPAQMYDTISYRGRKIKLRVAKGWARHYKAMKHSLHEDFEALRKGREDWPVEIIGWSLGSSQAMLCGQDLNWRYGVKAYCYTYGTVMPFFYLDKMTEEYLKSCFTVIMNFSHKSDLATLMVPFPGYRMLNKVLVGKLRLTDLYSTRTADVHRSYDDQSLYDGID